ncbi:MAG: cadherin repeat domain-containing protein [bacterium]
MSDSFNLDSRGHQRRFIARTKAKKGTAGPRGRGAGSPSGHGLLWNLSQGFKLRFKIVWIMLAAGVIAAGYFLFLGVSERPQQTLSADMTITRSVPAISRVYITPSEPTGRDSLLANVEIRGKQDKILFRYQWERNDFVIEGATGRTLNSALFERGDIIAVTAVPVMMAVEGKQVRSAEVRIANTPPAMLSASIKPKVLFTDTEVYVDAKAEDKDHDEIELIYQWVNNGVEIHGQNECRLDPVHYAKGDRIQVKVTPFDGFDHGTTLLSAVVIVNNSSPRIVSYPPTTLAEPGTFVYEVRAEDIDEDPIFYSLSPSSPPGVTIDRESGLLVWRIPHDVEQGLNRIEVLAQDSEGGETSQWFTLNLQFEVSQR